MIVNIQVDQYNSRYICRVRIYTAAYLTLEKKWTDVYYVRRVYNVSGGDFTCARTIYYNSDDFEYKTNNKTSIGLCV